MKGKKLDFKKFDLESYVGEYAQRTDKSRDGDAWFKCCFHDESTGSLHVSGKQVFHCHGCNAQGGILDFIMRVNDVNKKEALKIVAEKSQQEIVAVEVEYQYIPFKAPKSEAIYSYNGGHVLKYRKPNKDFVWANHENGSWWLGIGKHDVGLYKPNGIEGVVIVAEGEKDVDALVALGYTAVTSPNGANAWKESYTEELKQASHVVILNDNDQSGIDSAFFVNKSLVLEGIMTKRIIPRQFTDNDTKGLDIYDIIQEIGDDLTSTIINALIEEPSFWSNTTMYRDEEILGDIEVLGEVPIPEEEVKNETVEVEVVVESGLGEEYDESFRKMVQETYDYGVPNQLTSLNHDKICKELKIGKRDENVRLKNAVEELKVANMPDREYHNNTIVDLKSLGIKVDIDGSGYIVSESNTGIYTDVGEEIIGHFLSFVGVVIDAEADQDTNVKVALAFNTPQSLDKFNVLVLPKKELALPNDLIKILSGHNINVTSVNGLQVVKYIQDLQNFFGERTVTMKSLSRFGWYDGKLMPYEQNEGKIVFDSTVAQPIANKLMKQVGSREKSIELMNEIAQYSESCALIIGASIGSLILSYMNDGGNQSFALNVWNETSTGKTVTLQGVASMFGYPFKDNGWWGDGNATMNKDIYHNSLMGNLPTFIDDPALNRSYDSIQKRDYVYAVTSGEGRGRMKQSGQEAQATRSWCNIMIMTNETPFIDESVQNGGARARCLEICFEKKLDVPTVERWIDLMTHNHGLLAVEIAEAIRDKGKVYFENRSREWANWFRKNRVYDKRAVNASIIMMGLEVASETFGITPIDAKDWFVKQIRGSGELSDGARAYDKLMDVIQVSDLVYAAKYDHNNQYVGSYGWTLDGLRKVVNLPRQTIRSYADKNNFSAGSLVVWGYKNDVMVSKYDDDGVPKFITISERGTPVDVVQVYYEWSDENYERNDYS